SVAGSDVNPHLEDFANALRIPEVSQAKPSDASPDPRSPHSVFEAQLPFGEGLSTVRRGIDPDLVLFRHEAIVALKLLLRHPPSRIADPNAQSAYEYWSGREVAGLVLTPVPVPGRAGCAARLTPLQISAMTQEAGRPQVYDHRLRDLVRPAGAFPDRLRPAGSPGAPIRGYRGRARHGRGGWWPRRDCAGPLHPIRRPIEAGVSPAA